MTSKHLLLILLIALLLAACDQATTQVQTPSLTPTPPQPPDPGMATVIGRIINTEGEFQPRVIVRLAEVVRGIEGRGGAFILDTVHSPSIFTDEAGYFILPNIKAAEYVIVVGDVEITGIYEIIPQENGTARVFSMPADQVTNVGDITITIQPPQLFPGLTPSTPSVAYPSPVTYPEPVVATPYP